MKPATKPIMVLPVIAAAYAILSSAVLAYAVDAGSVSHSGAG
jgi:hypothetical protein